ncbi:MAG: hypothetical protein ACTSRI_10635 [Promethearchaeota archaeon]
MTEKKKVIYHPKFRVILTWIFFILGTILVILIFVALNGFNINLTFNEMQKKRYLYVYIELFSVGLIPLLISLICKDDPSLYGINMKRLELVKSILLSSYLVIFLFILGYLTNGTIISYEKYDFELNMPWNIFYGIFGIIVWGALEVFYFIWLVVNTDHIFNDVNRIFSRGLITTTVIFGLVHILTTQDLFNAFYTSVIFFILGFIHKYTKNSIGPMIAWTLINGQVWFIAQMLFI